jgi:dipeptidyl aminopeptidase/acylaminoacyl peptidase
MRKSWVVIALLLVAVAALAQNEAPATPETATAFPIEAYLNIRQAYDAHFTADDKTVLYRTNVSGTSQVWTVPVEGGEPTQITDFEDSVDLISPSPTDPNLLLFAKAVGGNERRQLFTMDAAGGNVRRLTDTDKAIFNFGCWSRDGKSIAYASNRRETAFFDIYVMDITTGEHHLVLKMDAYLEANAFSPSGRRLVVTKWAGNSDNDLYLLDLTKVADEPVHLTPHAGWATYESVRWPVGPRSAEGFYVISNLTNNFTKLAFLEIQRLKLDYVDMGPWDTGLLAASRNGVTLAYTINAGGFSRLAITDVKNEKLRPPPKMPQGVLYDLDLSDRGDKLLMTFTNPEHPADIYLADTGTGETRRLTTSSTGGVPRDSFVQPSALAIPSSDGGQIPTFIYFPPNLKRADKVPCIMHLHGGPTGQERPVFKYLYQYFLRQGYAIVAPNVRGSSGYGKAYTHLDDVDKRLDSVRDMADVVAFLKEHAQVIDTDRIALYGGSYGGYMVLAGLTEYPDLFAAGIDVVGIANFETFLQKTGAWRRAIRESEYGSLADDLDLLRRISPIHHVDKIRAPLMVIHGKNDPRVPFGEAEQIVAALQERNQPVELLAYDDEGHGLRKLTNKLDAYPKMAAFLARYLKQDATAP